MPTKITQIEDAERGKTVLRVEGSLRRDDAVLLEKIADEMSENGVENLTIDLADLDFLDSESAGILKNMETKFAIEGLLIFLQKVIEENENAANRRNK